MKPVGWLCGEGIYPRWTAQQAMAFWGPLRAPSGINPLTTGLIPSMNFVTTYSTDHSDKKTRKTPNISAC
jgi:hypothetical protein